MYLLFCTYIHTYDKHIKYVSYIHILKCLLYTYKHIHTHIQTNIHIHTCKYQPAVVVAVDVHGSVPVEDDPRGFGPVDFLQIVFQPHVLRRVDCVVVFG